MYPVDHILWALLAVVFGAIWGSFTNVVVHRLPLGESVVRPASRCPGCRTPIAWYHNIPVFSWVLLRGQCASCKQSFSVRYPLVEAAVGALSLAVWLKLSSPVNGSLPELVPVLVAWTFAFAFIIDLVAIALIDLDTLRIPDTLSLPGIILGLVSATLVGDVTGVTVFDSLMGLLIGGGSLLAITYGYFALTGREGMGLGDYRLMAMVGAFLGWRSLLFLMVASALQGLAFALLVRFTGSEETLPEEAQATDDSFRHMVIPFGPFIALSALEWLVFERPLMALFERWVFIAS